MKSMAPYNKICCDAGTPFCGNARGCLFFVEKKMTIRLYKKAEEL